MAVSLGTSIQSALHRAPCGPFHRPLPGSLCTQILHFHGFVFALPRVFLGARPQELAPEAMPLTGAACGHGPDADCHAGWSINVLLPVGLSRDRPGVGCGGYLPGIHSWGRGAAKAGLGGERR